VTSGALRGKIILMLGSLSKPFQHESETRRILPLFVLGVWVLYLVLSPFYVFPKGRPQPADFILVTAMLPIMALQLMNYRGKIPVAYAFGFLFVLMTIVTNLVNYLFYPDIRFLLTSLIYPYNFMVFLFVVWLFQQDLETMKKVTFYALIFTIGIQLAFMLTAGGYRGYRGTGGFENPNQFAYWNLLTASMIVYLRRDHHLRIVDFVALGLLAFLESLALSKAGIIAFSVFIILLFMTPKISKDGYVMMFFLGLITMIYLIYEPGVLIRGLEKLDFVNQVVERLEGIGSEPDDSPEARGYYRLFQNPLFTLLGSGEGAFYRFEPNGYNRELHSGIATMIFSYGIFGASMFFIFLLLLVYRQPWYYVLLFGPIFMFGLPHQNFRFAHFWVFLGINYGIYLAHYKRKAERKIRDLAEAANSPPPAAKNEPALESG